MRTRLVIAMFLSGCATSDARMKAEIKLASTLQTVGQKADEFRAARHDAVKNRQELLNQEQSDAARLTADTDQRVAVWKVTGDTRRQEVYADLIAATKATGDAWTAFEKLQADLKKALADAETKFAFTSDQLQSVIKALTTLGTPPNLEAQAMFYLDFALKTHEEMDRLNSASARDSAHGAAKAGKETSRSSSNDAVKRKADPSLTDAADEAAREASRPAAKSKKH
jgi:hypothetical protein